MGSRRPDQNKKRKKKHKAINHQLDFIGAFFQAKSNNRVFVKLDSRYADYLPLYSNYFGRALRLLKSIYGMANSGKLFADELTANNFPELVIP